MTNDDTAALIASVRRLSDIEEIRGLRNLYHYFVNEGQFSRFDEIYTEDATVQLDYVAEWVGLPAILEGFQSLPKYVSFIKQFLHNHHVVVDGDTATGFAYFEAKYAMEGNSLMVAGRYDEKYRRLPQGWRIADTRVQLFFSLPHDQGWATGHLNHVEPLEPLNDSPEVATVVDPEGL